MSEVIKLGITRKNNQKIEEIEVIEVLEGKGIVGDRHFRENNDARKQITLIESENIDDYNKKFNLNIPYLDFLRNIITKNIELNNLIGKKLTIGKTELEGIDLCRPCKNLQETLGHDNIIKEFLRKGGLRCKIVVSGKIKLGDQIKLWKN